MKRKTNLFLIVSFLGIWGLSGFLGAETEVAIPPDKSAVTEKAIVFTYKATELLKKASLTVQLNQQNLSAKIQIKDNLLYVPLNLNEGENHLTVTREGRLVKEFTYVYQGEEKPAPNGFSNFKFHEAYLGNECTECHDFTADPFSVTNLVTSEDGLSHCVECHDDKMKPKFLHGPVGMGACSACHDPHGGNKTHLLAKVGNELCYDCHEIVQTQAHLDDLKKDNPKVTTCLPCHDPHGTEKKFHLK